MSDPAPKNPLLQTMLMMVGQSNVITVHRPLVDFLDGNLEAAMLLGQLLYWTPRSVMGGWIAKSDIDFQNELCLKRYSVRAARDLLEKKNLIETAIRKFNAAPTQHYRVRMDRLDAQWRDFIATIGLSENGQSDCLKTDNPGLSENGQSLTEITTEITRERFAAILQKLALLTGGALNSSCADLISTWLEKHTNEWILQAIDIAMDKKARSEKYVDRVLIGWEANGYPKSRDEKIQGAKQHKAASKSKKITSASIDSILGV